MEDAAECYQLFCLAANTHRLNALFQLLEAVEADGSEVTQVLKHLRSQLTEIPHGMVHPLILLTEDNV